jgi:tRNA modification GTPase
VNDTIAAPATALGAAAVGVIRVSGPLARQILSRIFRPRFRPQGDLLPWRLHVGHLVAPSVPSVSPIDECLAVFMPAPKSYTGDDLFELHLHGSPALIDRAMALALTCGARLAEPGEFTRRAYLAGKLDLAQAEAVCELINAKTLAAARLAAEQLSGALSRRIEELRDGLADLCALAEAAIDFPEEVAFDPWRAAEALRGGPLWLATELLAAHREARPFREGAQVCICGRPNVGKSTLLNALLGRERALVSPEPGTTRDFIEEQLELGGVPVRLVDTAGLREAARGVEAQGVALAEDRLAASDLALVVLDASEPASPEDAALPARLAGRPHLVVLNKADLPRRLSPDEAARLFPQAQGLLAVSALRGEGLADLKARLAALLAPQAAPSVAPNLRHRQALEEAAEAMRRALEALEAGLPAEVYAFELKAALEAVGRIRGETATEEILERIFSRFCIGK